MRTVPVIDPELNHLGVSHGARTPGLHMSDLYGAYYQWKEPKRFKPGAMDTLRLEAGLALEEALERAFVARCIERPGEFFTNTKPVIVFSPDLLLFEDSPGVTPGFGPGLGELKLTWMSCRHWPVTKEQAFCAGLDEEAVTWDGTGEPAFPQKAEKYFCQMKLYCYHLGLQWARLIVCFVNGDYRGMKPCMLAWDIYFTPRELQEEWATIENFNKGDLL